MRKITIALFLLFFGVVNVVQGANGRIDRVVVSFTRDGLSVEKNVDNGDTLYFDRNTSIRVRIYRTSAGSSPYKYRLTALQQNWTKETSSTASSYRFSPPSPYEADYFAFIDAENGGDWILFHAIGQSPSKPDLKVRRGPEPSAQPPFVVGQNVDWSCQIKNYGDGTAPSTYVGYYLGNSPTDLSNRIEQDSCGKLDPSERTDEHESYSFKQTDVGTKKYLILKADYKNEANEENEGNNIKSFGPFEVRPPQPTNVTVKIQTNVSSGQCRYVVDGNTFSGVGKSFVWPVGSKHTISVATLQSYSSGKRYAFTSWSDGGSASHTITVNQSQTITANFSTQYYLTTAASPTNGGSVSPSSGWWSAGSLVTLKATPNSGYTFASWSGNAYGSSTTTLSMNGPRSAIANFACQQVTVRFQTNVSEIPYCVDGKTYKGTSSFTWTVGSQHAVSVDGQHSFSPDTRYVFSSWSDGGSASHTITVNQSRTITANFSTQYYLTTAASPRAGGSVSPSSGWWLAGTKVQLRAVPRSGYIFSNWSGNASGSSDTSITVYGPRTAIANFVSESAIAFKVVSLRVNFVEYVLPNFPSSVHLGDRVEFVVKVYGPNSVPVQNATVGIEDGFALQSSMERTNSSGYFAYSTRIEENFVLQSHTVVFHIGGKSAYVALPLEMPAYDSPFSESSLASTVAKLNRKHLIQLQSMSALDDNGDPYYLDPLEYNGGTFLVDSMDDVNENNYFYILQQYEQKQTDPYFGRPEILLRAQEINMELHKNIVDDFIDNVIEDTTGSPIKIVVYVGSGGLCASTLLGFAPGAIGCGVLVRIGTGDLLFAALRTLLEATDLPQSTIDNLLLGGKIVMFTRSFYKGLQSVGTEAFTDLKAVETVVGDQIEILDITYDAVQEDLPFEDIKATEYDNRVELTLDYKERTHHYTIMKAAPEPVVPAPSAYESENDEGGACTMSQRVPEAALWNFIFMMSLPFAIAMSSRKKYRS